MNALRHSSRVRLFAGLLALFMVAFSVGTQAQQKYVIKSAFSPETLRDNYSYGYSATEPNVYYALYSYMFYDYMKVNRDQYIILASDMRNAGMCAGPITSLAYRFTRAVRWDMNITIQMRHIPSSTVALNSLQSGLTTVYTNPNYVLTPIANNDTTWVDWQFQTPFNWDGTSNIVVDFCRVNNGTTLTYNIQNTNFLCTRVTPPLGPYNSYTGMAPWIMGYSYTFNGAPYDNCNTIAYGWYLNTGYRYDYNNYIYDYYIPYRPHVRLESGAGVSQSFPDEVDPNRILKAGAVHDGSSAALQKPSVSYYASSGQNAVFNYKIVGPLPSTNVVYQARSGGNTTITVPGTTNGLTTYTINEATGPLSRANGTLDLTNAVGGSYRVEVDFTNSCGTSQWRKAFIVAFPNDAAISLIRSPQALPKKNPVNVNLPLATQLQNVGLNAVTDADIKFTVRKYPGGQLVADGTSHWTGNLLTGDRSSVDLPTNTFIPREVGRYTAEACVTLNNAIDQQASNDCLPNSGGTHIFSVNYNEEAGAGNIAVPSATGTYYNKRPMRPSGVVVNGGILDLSNVPVRMEIYRNTPGPRTRVYNQQVIVQSVDAAAPLNLAAVDFPLFYPAEAGQYEACMTVQYPGDPTTDNDVVCQNFTVEGNLEGTYTIGLAKAGQTRNYVSIQSALDDLYRKGVSGAVKFQFTDANYVVGSGAPNAPAIDLSAAIPGVSSTNTITFEPSLERSLSKSSVVITLNSGSGVGVLFGQNMFPSNLNAVGREFPFVRSFSNSAGYITFDGGQQKSLRFDLNASTAHRAVFYMGDGSQNIKVANTIIGNASTATASYATALPFVYYLNGLFQYDADVRTDISGPITYSAGIVNRNKVPVGVSGNNSENLDTIVNINNQIVGNEISGFGYGVVTLGLGQLIKGGVNEFRSYYNTGTEIRNNLIFNAGRAGVFAGYEDGIKISNNRIYSVGASTGSTATDVAGIIAGGESRYNNMNLSIQGNEISGVRGNAWSRGIVVEQARNDYQSINAGAGGLISFPNKAEHTVIASNVIWGLARNSAAANMAGVHVWTRRATPTDLVTPLLNSYFTVGDSIVNNTILMQNDNVVGSGAVAGIGIQNSNGPVVLNNAIAMLGASNAAAVANTALLYEGTLFRNGRANAWYLSNSAPAPLTSNRNAFYAPNAAVARFIEISQTSELVSAGTQTEFQTIGQWRSWTRQDINSVVGDFTAEHEFQGIAPNQQYRVKVSPQAPIGSLLNNRGERLNSITKDVEGQTRGEAGLGYDIGADEFNGRLYVSDLEVVDILTPTSYRDATGLTSDAEYIMTKAPVDVTARIRNSGALAVTNAPIRVRIYMETATSNNSNAATPTWGPAVVDRVVNSAMTSGESKDIMFNIPSFTPATYFGTAGYTVPARFATMSNNVTPRFNVEISLASDENNVNNIYSKVVRFYVQKSDKKVLVSLTGSTNDILSGSPSTNMIAAKLNGDSLRKAMNDLGLINDLGAGKIAYDVFERSAWASRGVDYTMYKTMYWSHDQNAFTRTERDDLRNYLASGKSTDKRNLAMATQVPTRAHVGSSIVNDVKFVNTVLRANNVNPGTPYPVTYNGRRITGRAIGRNSVETISRTGFPSDSDPMPALMNLYSDATTVGVVNAAYSYNFGDRATTDSVAGTATSSLVSNIVYLGIDWRHFARQTASNGDERVLRGVIDFFEKNPDAPLSVELTNFDAKARGNDVDVFWSTSSESGSSHYLVDRADVAAAVAGHTSTTFNTVATEPAAINSTSARDYRITDKNLAAGTYLYRLTAVGKDGATRTTEEVAVTIVGEDGSLWLGDIAPNPVVSTARIEFGVAQAGEVSAVLVNAAGQQVAVLLNEYRNAGTQEVTLDASNLASGSYSLVLRSNGVAVTKNINIVK